MNHDQFVVRLVIVFLGLFALTTLAGGIYLTANGKAMPDALIAMGSVAVGAVGGILSRTSAGPTEVTVVNPGDDPVPVEDAGQSAVGVLVALVLILVALRLLGLI